MAKNLRWRLLAIAAVIALGVWMIYPLDEKVRLGLDLKGGVHLVLRVQTDEALRVESEASMERLRSELAKAGATGVTATVVSPTTFSSSGACRMRSRRSSASWPPEIEHTYNRESGAGGTYRFVMKPNIAVQMADDTVAQAIRTIENRVNELGVAEPVVARHGGRDQILVQLPGVTDVGRAKEIIRSTALARAEAGRAGPRRHQGGAAPGHQWRRASRARRSSPGSATPRRPASGPRRCITWCRRRRLSPAAISGPPAQRSTSTTSRRSASP